ncbi:MAG: hypothetical protein FWF29_07310, partial [Treponema sp.]|nr:hypothetical protein [Treponema sp.]
MMKASKLALVFLAVLLVLGLGIGCKGTGDDSRSGVSTTTKWTGDGFYTVWIDHSDIAGQDTMFYAGGDGGGSITVEKVIANNTTSKTGAFTIVDYSVNPFVPPATDGDPGMVNTDFWWGNFGTPQNNKLTFGASGALTEGPGFSYKSLGNYTYIGFSVWLDAASIAAMGDAQIKIGGKSGYTYFKFADLVNEQITNLPKPQQPQEPDGFAVFWIDLSANSGGTPNAAVHFSNAGKLQINKIYLNSKADVSGAELALNFANVASKADHGSFDWAEYNLPVDDTWVPPADGTISISGGIYTIDWTANYSADIFTFGSSQISGGGFIGFSIYVDENNYQDLLKNVTFTAGAVTVNFADLVSGKEPEEPGESTDYSAYTTVWIPCTGDTVASN